ncbi:hypothetical protein [Halobacillus andaensis]|uniref:hypothetical protein n=1 Tax=Halobacillus andaensis TaxID=1176239 RepID=UPI003D75F23E
MYEIVNTSGQQKKFEKTWEYFCKKFNWVNDPYALNGIRYNLLLPGNNRIFRRRKVIGTIEFIPYDPANPPSTVEGRYKFSTHKEIQSHQQKVWEIDKLCIHETYQRKGNFESVLHILYDHAMTHYPKYYVALMEKRLYRMVKFYYGYGVEKKGEELLGPTSSLVPVIIDVEQITSRQEYLEKLIGKKREGKYYSLPL